jgi:uncharacterized protein YggE
MPFSVQELVSQQNIQRASLSVLVLLAIFLFMQAGVTLKEWLTPGMNYSSFSVEGEGKVTATPNIASVSFSVNEEAEDVGTAQETATEKMNAALEFVKGTGVEDKDVKTTGYSISPQYEWVPAYCPQNVVGAPCRPGEQQLTGYQVSQSVTIKVRDTDKVGALLTGLGDLDIQNLSGPNFQIDDMTALKDQARGMAIKDAKEKARVLAKDLKVRLVRVTGFWESSDPGYPMAYGLGGDFAVAKTEASIAPNLPTGENEVVVRVTVTYEIR